MRTKPAYLPIVQPAVSEKNFDKVEVSEIQLRRLGGVVSLKISFELTDGTEILPGHGSHVVIDDLSEIEKEHPKTVDLIDRLTDVVHQYYEIDNLDRDLRSPAGGLTPEQNRLRLEALQAKKAAVEADLKKTPR